MPSWIVPPDNVLPNTTGHDTAHDEIADDLTLIKTAFPGVQTGVATTPVISGPIVQDQVSNLYTSSGAATGTITFASNPTAGAKMLVAIANNTGAPSLTDNGTSPATFVEDSGNNSGTNNIYIFRADNITLPASGPYQISFSSGGNTFAAAAVSYTGLRAGGPVQSNNNIQTNTTPNTGSVTAAGLAFAAFDDDLTSTHSVTNTASSFTELATSTSGGGALGAFGMSAYNNAGVPASMQGSWLLGSSTQNAGCIAVYQPSWDIVSPTIYGTDVRVVGFSANSGATVFEVDNATPAARLLVTDQGTVTTKNNILDDGSGNVTFNTITATGAGLSSPSGAYISMINTGTAQYSGSGFIVYSNTSSLGSQGGISFVSSIGNVGATQGYAVIGQVDHTGAPVRNLLIIDLNAQTFTFEIPVITGNLQVNGTLATSGLASFNGGTDTSGTATASSPSFTSGTAKQLSTTQDVILYIAVQTAASLAVAIGPTSTPANTIMPTQTYALGLQTVRVPKGWWVKITGTIADLTITQVTC